MLLFTLQTVQKFREAAGDALNVGYHCNTLVKIIIYFNW